ncbi:MAG: isopenicillin N synthase family oxygenase [Rhizobiales bacterium]|nr:isopenicillin N synthase family oxygenase [Hyphomicrobiales bacterium]
MSDFNVLAIDQNAPDAPARFVTSLHETGFAVLHGHQISADEISGMYGAWADFFSGDERFAHANQPGSMHGYYGFKSENAKDSKFKDLKEFYHVYQDCPVPEATEAQTRQFHSKLLEIGAQLLGWLDSESPEDVKAHLSEPLTGMIKDSQQNLLRILHYPPLADDVEPGEVRAAAHEDINLITLLVTGTEPGLQARDTRGNWHDVPCEPGMITINAGDMLAKATGGYYPSTSHRVVNPSRQENRSRYSMPLFVHPRPNVRLDENQTAGEYLDERLREIGLK